MEEDLVVEENTQVISKIDLVEIASFYRRTDFDFCSENNINILSQNQ